MSNKITGHQPDIWIEGICFICKQATKDPTAYAHYECCLAYEDKKRKEIKELNKDNELF